MGGSNNTVSSLEIIESVLSETDYNDLFSVTTGKEISWYFHPMYHFFELLSEANSSTHGFMHNFFDNNKIASNYIYLINPIMDKMQFHFGKSITAVRVKMNMTLNIGKQVKYYSHIDKEELLQYGSRWKTAIYYVNNSDGDTIFFDNEQNIIYRQTPTANTLVVFDGNTLHAPQLPLVSDRRIVININVLLDE